MNKLIQILLDDKLPWEKELFFEEIIDRYIAYVKLIDAESNAVVCDTYSAGPTTNDASLLHS